MQSADIVIPTELQMYTIKSYRIEYINFIKHIILLEFDIYIDLTESTDNFVY